MKTRISMDQWGGRRLFRVLAMLMAFALAPSILHANAFDATGAWLLKWDVDFGFGRGLFVLNVFHQGGTLTGDLQGESAFNPQTTDEPTSPFNVITTPQSGVWKMKGRSKFVATFLVIEYRVLTEPSPGSPVFQISKVQYTGKLKPSGDEMELQVLVTHYDSSGNQTSQDPPFAATGVRIPLEHTDDTLPIPD